MGEARRTDVRRTTVAEAAEFLGISAEAVRGRVRRGTLPVEREGGTVYVLLDRPAPDRTTADQPRTTGGQPTDRTELVEELRDRIRYLERQVEQANERDSENRRVILALTSRIPELQAAPPEATGGPQPVEEPERGTAPGTPETPAQRPSWWRRFWR